MTYRHAFLPPRKKISSTETQEMFVESSLKPSTVSEIHMHHGLRHPSGFLVPSRDF
jgi:hypothetical protein